MSDAYYCIKLKCGRDILLNELHQSRTYSGLLEGVPTRRLNRELLQEAQEDAKKKLWNAGTPFLIQPVETPLPTPKEEWFKQDEDWQPIQIPAVRKFIS